MAKVAFAPNYSENLQSMKSSDRWKWTGPFIFHKCLISETIIANIVSCPFIIHSSCIWNQPFYEFYAGQTQRKTNSVFQTRLASPVLVGPVALLL